MWGSWKKNENKRKRGRSIYFKIVFIACQKQRFTRAPPSVQSVRYCTFGKKFFSWPKRSPDKKLQDAHKMLNRVTWPQPTIFLPNWPLVDVKKTPKERKNGRAVVLAQLVERSLSTPEVQGSNTVVGKRLYRTFVYCELYWKDENKIKEPWSWSWEETNVPKVVSSNPGTITGWTFFHIIYCKNCNVCLKRRK